MLDSLAVVASVKIHEEHIIVLRGVLRGDPEKKLSDLIADALGPYCDEHREAAGKTQLRVDTSEALQKEPEANQPAVFSRDQCQP